MTGSFALLILALTASSAPAPLQSNQNSTAAPPLARAPSPPAASSSFTVTGVFSDGTAATRIFEVGSDKDSDADGIPDAGLLRINCVNGAIVSAAYKPSSPPSGAAAGKRKSIDKASPLLFKKGEGSTVGTKLNWDMKEAKGARTASTGGLTEVDDWQEVSLAPGAAGLCA